MTKVLIALMLVGGCASSSVHKFRNPYGLTAAWGGDRARPSWCRAVDHKLSRNREALHYIHVLNECVERTSTAIGQERNLEADLDLHRIAHFRVCMNEHGYTDCD